MLGAFLNQPPRAHAISHAPLTSPGEHGKEISLQTKSIVSSKTFWFNVVAALNLALNAAGIPTVPPELADGLAIIGNIVLRFFTDTKVTVTGEPSNA